nr:hypothetical protein [Tanacetum cinerariifolium]
LQISSAFGKPMETVNRERMMLALYPLMLKRVEQGELDEEGMQAVIAMSADGSVPSCPRRGVPEPHLSPDTLQSRASALLQEPGDCHVQRLPSRLSGQQRRCVAGRYGVLRAYSRATGRSNAVRAVRSADSHRPRLEGQGRSGVPCDHACGAAGRRFQRVECPRSP